MGPWIGRLENLFIALKLTDPFVAEGEDQNAAKVKEIDDRKRALLLHFVGERTYDIYEAQKGLLKRHTQHQRKC